jgi:diacylglycerol kinase (ATP)
MNNKKTPFSVIARLRSFKYAANGLLFFFKNQPNGQVHLFATLVVVFVALFVGVSSIEWLFVCLAITLVVSSEIFNTAIEALADKVEPDVHPQIKIVKDLAAGAVLVCATFALIVALVIFIPKIFPNGFF